jgi:hypothetical protein
MRLIMMVLAGTALVACGPPPVERALTFDGPRTPQLERDEVECRNIARNYDNGNAQWEAGSGAIIGGLAGALDSDPDEKGDVGAGLLVGAAVGAATGAAGAKIDNLDDRRVVLIRCMQGRGHSVLG